METTNNTSEVNHVEKPQNVVEQYKAYLQELASRREAIKVQMGELAEELKSINTTLDGEKQDVLSIRSMLTQTRKRRESKAPVEKDATTGEPVQQKRRGRPKKNADAPPTQ